MKKYMKAHLELTVRRIKWMQNLVRAPTSGGAMFAAMFGRLPGEKPEEKNPWVMQLCEDLICCSVVPFWDVFFKHVAEQPLSLFNDHDMKNDFLAFDHRELRAVLLNGLKHEYHSKDEQPCIDGIRCDIDIGDGELCKYVGKKQCGCDASQNN